MNQIIVPAEVLNGFLVLADTLERDLRCADERSRLQHERFNVFTTLLPAHDEVRLHTRFLHSLLDSEGLHDCGSSFLDLFFVVLAEVPGQPVNEPIFAIPPADPKNPWIIHREVATTRYGQLDLLIERRGFGIGIENKIYAWDQDRQIECYADYLSERFGENWLLFYLTLDGKPSYTDGGRRYLRISYRDHILPWLDRCISDTTDIAPVHHVLVQYRRVVWQLTGKAEASKIMNDTVEFLMKHPALVRHSARIAEATVAVRHLFLDRLAEALRDALAPELQVTLRSKLWKGRFGVDDNGALIVAPPLASPLRGAPFEIWVEHIRRINDAVVVGIESAYEKAQPSDETTRLFSIMDRLLEKEQDEKHWHKSEPRHTWSGTYWPTGSHDLVHPFTDEKLAEFLARPLKEVAAELAQEIRHHVTLMERVYVQAQQELANGSSGAPS